MTKLNQVVAVEKTIKSKVNSEGGALNKASQRPELFNGLSRTYEPIFDEGEKLPAEYSRVQMRATEVLSEMTRLMVEIFDITATKDWANCKARADVVVDDEVVLEGVPTQFLLFLEKNLEELRGFIDRLPTLDPKEDWIYDENQGLYRTAPSRTQRTRKVQKAIVLYDATDKHPAQTQLITEDETAGYWHRVLLSGAMPEKRKKQLVDRVDKLRNAVKFAREEANTMQVDKVELANRLFGWVTR